MTSSSSSDDDSSLASNKYIDHVPMHNEEHEYYEYLGYPTVLYRNRDCYTFRDVLLTNPAEDLTTAEEFCDQQAHLSRCYARWYYPTDNLCRAIAVTPDFYPDATSLLSGLQPKRRNLKAGKGGETFSGPMNKTDEGMETDGEKSAEAHQQEAEKEPQTAKPKEPGFVYAEKVPVYPRVARQKQMRKRRLESLFSMSNHSKYPEDTYLEVDALDDHHQETPVAFPLQDVVRANMIRAAAEQMQPSWELDRLKLRTFQTLDANYAKWPTSKAMDPQTLLDLSAFYDRERMDYADPAYQALFPLELVQACLGVFNNKPTTVERRLGRIKDIDHYAPHLFGNCIFVAHCGCAACDGTKFPAFYILHPVGQLLDRVRLSFLQFPQAENIKDEMRREEPAELKLDDRLLQIVKCGDNPTSFVARTFIDITVFEVTFIKPTTQSNEGCYGNAKLTTIHKINHVSFSRYELSFRPRCTTAHPEFASNLTPSRIATIYNCSNNGESNFIRTLSAGASTFIEEEYTIKNLKEITDIEYHNHPMVLWAAGRSYVRPALEANRLRSFTQPLVGLGSALYTVDLRNSEIAVFQWSPSAEAYLVEGIQSVSGIAVDPNHEYRLWVSSIASQRTWELDSRMPCRSVCSYSLPFLADIPPKLVDKYDLIGSGMLFCFPQQSPGMDNVGTHLPVLGISKRPRAYGIHCYHRHSRRSTFQKRPTEVFAGPMFPTSNVSLVKSSSFGLPEISDAIFHCGLAAFEGLVEQYLNPDSLPLNVEPRDHLLSTISMTNRGDLYSHTMLRSTSPDRHGVECPRGHWAGSSIVEIPETSLRVHKEYPSDLNILPLTVSNHEPITSRSIDLEKTGFTNRWLDPLELRGRTMNLRDPSKRAKYEQHLDRCFPPVDAFADYEHGTLNEHEALEFDGEPASIQLGKSSRPDALATSFVLRRSGVSSSTSYRDCFDVCPSVVETGDDEPRSDLTRAVLESMWSDNSESEEV